MKRLESESRLCSAVQRDSVTQGGPWACRMAAGYDLGGCARQVRTAGLMRRHVWPCELAGVSNLGRFDPSEVSWGEVLGNSVESVDGVFWRNCKVFCGVKDE